MSRETEGQLSNILVYPLSGGPGTELNSGFLSSGGGLLHDRTWVAYDSSIDPTTAKNRLSIKRYGRQLSGLWLGGGFDSLAMYRGDSTEPVVQLHYNPEAPVQQLVNEFGELPEVRDAGDTAAEQISSILGVRSARLAVKTNRWLLAAVGPAPAERVVAPLHIVTQASVDALQEVGHLEEDYDFNRFRPSLVFAGNYEPGEEQSWIGRSLKIGNATIHITRATIRCAATGRSSYTGRNHGDVPKLFKAMQQMVDGKSEPVMGVYGYAEIAPGSTEQIKVGMEVLAA